MNYTESTESVKKISAMPSTCYDMFKANGVITKRW